MYKHFSGRPLGGMLMVILSAVLFGMMPLAAKLIYAGGANAPTVVMLRSTLSLPLLWLLYRSGPDRSRPAFRAQLLLRMAPLSILGMVLTPILLYSSYNYISSSTATTVHFVYPIFVLLGCVLFFNDRLSRVKLLCAILCLAGILLFYTPGAQTGLLGLALAFLSGITYAAYIILLDKSGLAAIPPVQLSLGCTVISSLSMAAFLLLSGKMALPHTLPAWGLSIVLALVISLGGVLLFQIGVRKIGAQNAAILSTFEPITSIIIGIVVFQEPFGFRTALGVLSILIAVLLLTLSARRETMA